MRFDDLTGRELRELTELLGRPFMKAMEDTDSDAFYAFYWIAKRRQDPNLEFDTVLDEPLSAVMAYIQQANEADPTGGQSGAG